ncbi:MAG: DUF362 domain-containing protein [Deltaproteobacteria bacterium]|nr:DUF362 domain-containing protein [Deltaproteobacteria bacterium]
MNKIVLTVLITALLVMPVLLACSHKKMNAVDTVDYDAAKPDSSLIGAVRLTPESSYVGVPDLLEKYIKEKDEAAWREIREKINYTYSGLSVALRPVVRKDNFKDKIVAEIKAGKKLFFKPNLVNPRTLDLVGDGTPGSKIGIFSCTDWAFVAALMRFFHDEFGILYYQMAIGDAGVSMPCYSGLLKCPPEALIEGTPYGVNADYWVGWPFYFVRKYLAETTTPYDSKDDPQNGYMDSIKGNYVTPGQATIQGKLMIYDLNNAEWFDRGRRVDVPDGGDNHKEGIVIHKAIVGDPDDLGNYPGCILINASKLKVHSATIFTCAIKNLGMGGWPMSAGHDSNVKTTDWLYSYPPASPPGLKAVYHDKWYVVEVNDEGMPLKITDKPNMGLDGTMVDMNLAIKGQVPYVLHVVSAVNVIDIEQFGTGSVARQEGLILASTNPIALDMLCARYMFKNVPGDPIFPDKFARTVPLPRYDKTSGAIVTDIGVDERVLRSRLFDYAARRGLGGLSYYVEGRDETTTVSSPLVSKNGHFGRIEEGRFVEIMTDHLYFHQGGSLWDLQPSVLAYAQATDQLSGSNYYDEFMALDEDQDGIIDDRERGRNGLSNCTVVLPGIGLSLIGKGEVEHGVFFIYSRLLKYADPAWNVGNVDSLRVFVDSMTFPVAWRMATDKEKKGEDPFFGIPYGAVDGKPRWPSLQFARYRLEMFFIYDFMYVNAAAYSQKTGKEFKFYVPSKVPYAPPSPPGKPPWSYNPIKVPYIVELDPTDPNYSKLVFTIEFSDETW